MSSKVDNIEAIQRAAARLFAETSFEATSLRDIATAAGVSVGTLQYYFPSKKALFDDVLVHYYRRLDSLQEQLVVQCGTLADVYAQVDLIVRACYRFGLQEREVLRMAVRDILLHGKLDDDRRINRQIPFLASVVESILKQKRGDGTLFVRSMMHLINRYAVTADIELREICNLDEGTPIEQAYCQIEDHLAHIAAVFLREATDSSHTP